MTIYWVKDTCKMFTIITNYELINSYFCKSSKNIDNKSFSTSKLLKWLRECVCSAAIALRKFLNYCMIVIYSLSCRTIKER